MDLEIPGSSAREVARRLFQASAALAVGATMTRNSTVARRDLGRLSVTSSGSCLRTVEQAAARRSCCGRSPVRFA